MDCTSSADPNSHGSLPLLEAVGYQCVSPTDFATLKTHHSALHAKINKDCKK